jgi:hypothetical protein
MTEEQKIILENIRAVFQDTPAQMVICDETNNTPEDIENGVVNITIIPFKSVEHIKIEYLVKKDD